LKPEVSDEYLRHLKRACSFCSISSQNEDEFSDEGDCK
jgi:hypothetical protein